MCVDNVRSKTICASCGKPRHDRRLLVCVEMLGRDIQWGGGEDKKFEKFTPVQQQQGWGRPVCGARPGHGAADTLHCK